MTTRHDKPADTTMMGVVHDALRRARIQGRRVTFFADPACQQADQIYRSGPRRGTYFRDPNGHLMEILTPAT